MPRLSLLVLKTHKMDALRDFYESMGFDFEEEQHGKGPLHYSAQVGNVVLELYPLAEGTVADATTRLGFSVPDVVACVNAARDSAGRIESKANSGPQGLRALLRDPDGRAVELLQEPEDAEDDGDEEDEEDEEEP